MTEKPNFFKLGIFILIALALIVAGLIIFGSGAFAKEKVYFETYFADSVHGLSQGSSVQLSGVKIGAVENVTFVRKSYDLPLDNEAISKYDQYVHVICSAIEENLPIPDMETGNRANRLASFVQRGLRLRLASNIITGQAYLEATILDPERFPATEVPWKPKYTYIPSAPSTFRSMQNSLDQILDELQQVEFNTVADNVNMVLENLNQAILDASLGALSAKARQLLSDADTSLKSLSEKAQKLVVDADQAVVDTNVKGLSTKVNVFIDELRQSNQDLKKLLENPDSKKELANIPVLVDKFNQTLSQLDQLIVSETPEVQEIMENIRQLSENLNYLTARLKDNPSELLFSAPPPKKEK